MKFFNLIVVLSLLVASVSFAQVAVDPNSVDSGILESTAESSYPENSAKACHVQSTFSVDGPTLFDGPKIDVTGGGDATKENRTVK